MLQLASRMYFDEGADTHESVHRRVLYTNGRMWIRAPFSLTVCEVAPSTSIDHVGPIMVTATEHIQKAGEEPQAGELISTGGDELVADIADVLSFAWNLTVSPSADLVARLVPTTLNPHSQRSLTGTFARTFDPDVVVTDTDIEAARAIFDRLLALHRTHFEAAMRAIRRLTIATRSAMEDPTMAYADIVAALESLSGECKCHRGETWHAEDAAGRPEWGQLTDERASRIDRSLADLDLDDAQRIREAILDGEQAGVRQRFTAFVLAHMSQDFYGEEASTALRPLRRPDARRLLLRAYDIRSQHVHSLHQLPREASGVTLRADTITLPDGKDILTLEGLARVARHAIRNYIDRAPTDLDTSFEWRKALPGRFVMRVSPEYWMWNAAGFTHKSAAAYFNALLETTIDLSEKRTEGIVDMSSVLEKIERHIKGLAPGEAKTTMAAIYTLWHGVVSPDLRRKQADGMLPKLAAELEAPSMQSLAVALMIGPIPDWTLEQWDTFAKSRLGKRRQGLGILLPSGFDAALHLMHADALFEAGKQEEARVAAEEALGELPGNPQLAQLVAALTAGEWVDVDTRDLLA